MKKYIRDLIDDLHKKDTRDFAPPVPPVPADAPTVDLDAPPEPVVPEDLENQELSPDPEERVKQLDYQAQQEEERETLG